LFVRVFRGCGVEDKVILWRAPTAAAACRREDNAPPRRTAAGPLECGTPGRPCSRESDAGCIAGDALLWTQVILLIRLRFYEILLRVYRRAIGWELRAMGGCWFIPCASVCFLETDGLLTHEPQPSRIIGEVYGRREVTAAAAAARLTARLLLFISSALVPIT
jgi:hypothetical protein